MPVNWHPCIFKALYGVRFYDVLDLFESAFAVGWAGSGRSDEAEGT